MTKLEIVNKKSMNFSKRVRGFRLANHLSQEELGGLLGCTGNYVYLLEKRKKEPSDSLAKLFESLASSPVYEPILDAEERGIAIGVGSGIPINLSPEELAAQEAAKAKAALDYILTHADEEKISMLVGMLEAARQSVPVKNKKKKKS